MAQGPPMDIDEYIRRHTAEVTLADGLRLVLRPVSPADKERMAEAFERLSPETRMMRFHRIADHLTAAELRHLTELDYKDHFAWAAIAVDEPGQPGVGVARYVREAGDPSVGEAAVVVADSYQGRGIGTVLVRLLAETAALNGIREFRAYVLPANRRVREALESAGARTVAGDRIVEVLVALPLPEGDFAGTALHELLRGAARGEVAARSLVLDAKIPD